MKSLLELIKLIFGPKALSKTIGTRTNVIQLPNNKIKRYIKEDLNIEAASDAAAMNAKKEMEELIAEIPKMNDAERLIFEGNLKRLKNRLGIRSEKDPTADVYEFGTKLKATPKGIETLTEQAGQKSPPGTLMGDLESRINKLKASGKELEDIAKEKGGVKFSIPEEGIFNQELSADNLFDTIIKQQERFRKIQNSGLITSTAREILQRDIKAGKLKLPKEIEDRIMLVDGNPGTVNPVEVFRTNYGEDALEQIDSLIPELANAQSYSDLVKIVEKKYPMKPLAKPRKETMSLDEATKAEEENILTPKKPEEPEEFAMGGRVRYSDGTKPSAAENTPSQAIINRMMAQIKQMSKMGADIDTIKTITGASDQMIKDVLGKASGGRMSKGLDYLMGIERRGYAEGTDPTTEALKLLLLQNSGGDSNNFAFSVPTKEESEATLTEGMTDVGENKGLGSLGSMAIGGILSAVNPVLGMAYSLADPNSMTRQALASIGFNPTTEGSIGSTDGPFGGYGGFDGTEGSFGSVDTQAQSEASMSEGMSDVGDSSGGVDSAGDGGDGYATGGLVNRTGFKFGTKFGRFWKIARKVWDDINPTGDRKYDAQLVADELADKIFNKFMDELPQNVQIDLYALAYNNAPKVDALFRNPQTLSEAAKKGMAASKEMESLGLDVTKNSDFFKYEEMKLSGQLGPEHQVQAYKDKIRDEFSGVIDDTLMKQVEVDDNPQRLAEVYASIKEGLEMQKRGMTPEEIVRIMKQTPRTKNSQGGLNYLMGY